MVWVRVPSCGSRARSGWASCALHHVTQLPWSVPTTHQCQQPLPTVVTNINDSRQILSPKEVKVGLGSRDIHIIHVKIYNIPTMLTFHGKVMKEKMFKKALWETIMKKTLTLP